MYVSILQHIKTTVIEVNLRRVALILYYIAHKVFFNILEVMHFKNVMLNNICNKSIALNLLFNQLFLLNALFKQHKGHTKERNVTTLAIKKYFIA